MDIIRELISIRRELQDTTAGESQLRNCVREFIDALIGKELDVKPPEAQNAVVLAREATAAEHAAAEAMREACRYAADIYGKECDKHGNKEGRNAAWGIREVIRWLSPDSAKWIAEHDRQVRLEEAKACRDLAHDIFDCGDLNDCPFCARLAALRKEPANGPRKDS